MKSFSFIQKDFVAVGRGIFECVLRRRDWRGSPESAAGNVFGVCYERLGDLWVELSHLIWLARRTGRRQKFSFVGVDWLLDPESLCEREALASEILRLFNAESDVQIVRETITRLLPVHPPRNGRIIQISPRYSGDSHLVAYQFVGISRSDVNPTPEEVSSFLSLFDEHQTFQVGLPKTLLESIHVIEQAWCFIGVSSGMSHIAASLGKLCFIYFKTTPQEYERVRRWHPYPGTKFFSSAEELSRLIGARKASPGNCRRPN